MPEEAGSLFEGRSDPKAVNEYSESEPRHWITSLSNGFGAV